MRVVGLTGHTLNRSQCNGRPAVLAAGNLGSRSHDPTSRQSVNAGAAKWSVSPAFSLLRYKVARHFFSRFQQGNGRRYGLAGTPVLGLKGPVARRCCRCGAVLLWVSSRLWLRVFVSAGGSMGLEVTWFLARGRSVKRSNHVMGLISDVAPRSVLARQLRPGFHTVDGLAVVSGHRHRRSRFTSRPGAPSVCRSIPPTAASSTPSRPAASRDGGSATRPDRSLCSSRT